ncbi:MAG: phosphatidylserine decarboxylase [Kiritimatiellia bacterium]
MNIRREVIPFLILSFAAGAVAAGVCLLLGVSAAASILWPAAAAAAAAAYLLYFFRDPERTLPADSESIVAGADGVVAHVMEVRENEYLKEDAVRVSIFLSLFDVHVNRAPISGQSRFLGYFPGKRFFTFMEKSSKYNQHNSILITGERTRCLVRQIVGPVCRRVVYWLNKDESENVRAGQKIGMMKFGSRLDMYFPKGDVKVTVAGGQKVTAGETVIAELGKAAS